MHGHASIFQVGRVGSVIVASLVLNSCTSLESPAPPTPARAMPPKGPLRDPVVARILETLRKAPPWTKIQGEGGDRQRRQLMKDLEDIAVESVPQIGVALDIYFEEARATPTIDVDALSKMFVLNRCVFAIPESAVQDDSSAWVLPPSASLLWPLERTGEKLTLVGEFQGFKGDYWPLAELGAFNGRYGRRVARGAERAFSREMPGDRQIVVQEVLRALREAPPWTSMGGIRENAERLELTDTFKMVAQCDIADIREAVRLYVLEAEDSYSELDMLSKVFILNRFIFAVPDEKVSPVGGWTRPAGGVSMMWPLAMTPAGPQIMDRFRGYFGGAYLAQSEFDYFYRLFGLRKSPLEKQSGQGQGQEQ